MMTSPTSTAEPLKAAGKEIRIMPAGVFRANDGRPAGLPGWRIDAAIAARIVADLASRDELVIDYEHQSLLAKQNGHPVPAAGWFGRVAWREGQGLFAVDVKWTAKARQMIAASEYRYISPVFTYNDATGEVDRLLNISLTNTPGLNSLTDLAGLSSSRPAGAATGPRESDRGIDAFNSAFGGAGVFDPDTPSESLAGLAGTVQKPHIPPSTPPDDAEVLRRSFPNVFAGR